MFSLSKHFGYYHYGIGYLTSVSCYIDVIQTGTYFGVCLNGMTEILLNCKVAVLIPPSVQVHRLTLVTLLYLVADLINVRQRYNSYIYQHACTVDWSSGSCMCHTDMDIQ